MLGKSHGVMAHYLSGGPSSPAAVARGARKKAASYIFCFFGRVSDMALYLLMWDELVEYAICDGRSCNKHIC